MIVLLAIACLRAVPLPSLVDPPVVRWPAAPDPPRVGYVGAVELPGMLRPLDVGCGDERLAIADPERGEVWLVDTARERLVRVPRGPASPHAPVGITILPDGGLAVADGAQILRWTPGTDRWRPVDVLFERPTVAQPDGPDGLLVVDAAAHHLVRVSAGPQRTVGARGPIGEGFNFPVDAVPDGAGGWWVVDALNAAVQHVGDDGSTTFVAGGPGEGGAALVRPKGVAVDRWGRLHVVDGGMQHVQVYASDGTLVGRYGAPGQGAGELALPAGICIDGRTIYVADSLNARVQIYELIGEET